MVRMVSLCLYDRWLGRLSLHRHRHGLSATLSARARCGCGCRIGMCICPQGSTDRADTVRGDMSLHRCMCRHLQGHTLCMQLSSSHLLYAAYHTRHLVALHVRLR